MLEVVFCVLSGKIAYLQLLGPAFFPPARHRIFFFKVLDRFPAALLQETQASGEGGPR